MWPNGWLLGHSNTEKLRRKKSKENWEETVQQKKKQWSGVYGAPGTKCCTDIKMLKITSNQICILKWQYDTFLTIRLGSSLKTDTSYCQESSEVVVQFYTLTGKITGLNFLESNWTWYKSNFFTTSTYLNPAFPLLGIHPEEISRNWDKVLYSQMFSAGLFMLANSWGKKLHFEQGKLFKKLWAPNKVDNVAQENDDWKAYLMTCGNPHDTALIEENKIMSFLLVTVKPVITIDWVPTVCKALC